VAKSRNTPDDEDEGQATAIGVDLTHRRHVEDDQLGTAPTGRRRTFILAMVPGRPRHPLGPRWEKLLGPNSSQSGRYATAECSADTVVVGLARSRGTDDPRQLDWLANRQGPSEMTAERKTSS